MILSFRCETLDIVDKQLITSSAAKYLKQIDDCNTKFNLTIIFVVVGLILALFLVFCIVKAVRKFYKVQRPKIKKTFVVKKNYTQTPLTSRPLAAEQCEITIENCCNMNICDTVSFLFLFVNYFFLVILFMRELGEMRGMSTPSGGTFQFSLKTPILVHLTQSFSKNFY